MKAIVLAKGANLNLSSYSYSCFSTLSINFCCFYVSFLFRKNIGNAKRNFFISLYLKSFLTPCKISVRIIPNRSINQYQNLLLLISLRFPSHSIFPSNFSKFFLLLLSISSLKARFTNSLFVLTPVSLIPSSTSLSSKTILVLTPLYTKILILCV